MWMRQVITEFFPDSHPRQVFVMGTTDSGANVLLALRNMGIAVHTCDAHSLNTIVGWALGLNGTTDLVDGDGNIVREGSCNNKEVNDFLAKVKRSVRGAFRPFKHHTHQKHDVFFFFLLTLVGGGLFHLVAVAQRGVQRGATPTR